VVRSIDRDEIQLATTFQHFAYSCDVVYVMFDVSSHDDEGEM